MAQVQLIEKEKGKATMLPIANSLQIPNGKLKWIVTPFGTELFAKTYGLENLVKENVIKIVEL